MSPLLQNLRYAVRQLAQRPAFTVVAVLALALGIGANTAIFSVVNAVLLRPLPFPEPGRLVVLNEQERSRSAGGPVAAETFRDWREQSRTLSGMAAWTFWGLSMMVQGEPTEVVSVRASADLFDVLGVHPFMGRGFTEDEEQPGRDVVAVLSYSLWRNALGADPEVLGRTLRLDDVPYTIIGVMPEGFRFPDAQSVGLWTPLAFKPFEVKSRAQRQFDVIARVADGRTLDEVRAEMEGISRRLGAEYPRSNATWGAAVVPAHDVATASSRETLLLLLGAVAFVLLIACANVGNLLLARAAEREKEIALRLALGAARARLVRQLLAESVLLALLGGAAGLVLALWGIDLITTLGPGRLPHWNAVRIDVTVLAFTLVLSLGTVVLAGLLPALAATSGDLQEALKESGKATASGRRRRLRHALVIAEVALAIMLLASAGLLIRSLQRVESQDPGFRPDGLLATIIFLPSTRYYEGHQQIEFFASLLERTRALPGVISAGAVTTLPMSPTGIDHDLPVFIEGREPAPNEERVAGFRIATPGYFETIRVPILAGRTFTERDNEQASLVAVVNKVFADRFFPGETAVGKRFRHPRSGGDWIEIVGVIGQMRHRGLDADPRPEMFVPYRQLMYGGMTVVLRTAGDPASLEPPVKQAVHAVDPLLPINEMSTMTDLVSGTLAQRHFNMVLFVVFAGAALALAAIGIYGVIAYTVSGRTREFGIRMALGATGRDVVRNVVGAGVRLAVIGSLIGLAGALLVTRTLSGMLYGISTADPLTFAAVAAILILVAIVACVVPARRATRVDPMLALRYE